MILPMVVPKLDEVRSLDFIGKVIRWLSGKGLNIEMLELGTFSAVRLTVYGSCSQIIITDTASNRVALVEIAQMLANHGYRTAVNILHQTAFDE